MKPVFDQIDRIQYEGPASRNPLAFKHYHASEMVAGKPMREHLRFAVVYWHTFRGTGSDPFGMGTMQRPWDDGSASVANAQKRVRVAFEFMSKLGAPYYCWHDRDVAPEGRTLAETNKNFEAAGGAAEAAVCVVGPGHWGEDRSGQGDVQRPGNVYYETGRGGAECERPAGIPGKPHQRVCLERINKNCRRPVERIMKRSFRLWASFSPSYSFQFHFETAHGPWT